MRKILTLGVSVFIGVILSQSYLLASEPENYRVNGKIKNATSNGEVPAGLSVALHSEHLEKGAGMFHTFTEADGSFEFPSIEVEEDTLYRSEEHTSELQSLANLVCRLLLEKKK